MNSDKGNNEEKPEKAIEKERDDQELSTGDANEDAVSARPGNEAEGSGEGEDIEHETEGDWDDPVSDIEWENRVLCEDGNCIGVIGPDGLCKECGKRYEGSEQIFAPEPEADETGPISTDEEEKSDSAPGRPVDEESVENDDEEVYDDEEDSGSTEDVDLEWEQRKLCSDGNCIGVIGPDGLCKECGKSYEGDV